MITVDRRTDEPLISIFTRSGVETGDDKRDERKEFENLGKWFRETMEKLPISDI